MRCLYCGKQLALFKKLTGGGEFCSDLHRQSYHEEYNKLALNRLMEAQTRQEDQTPHPPGAGADFAARPETPALAQPTARGGYFKQTVTARNPGMAMLAASALAPTQWPVALPSTAEAGFVLGLAPEPEQAGVIMEHRGVPGDSAVIAPAAEFSRFRAAPRCALPEGHFEGDTAVVPAAAGPVGLDACPAPPPEPELRHESARSFQWFWEIPEGLSPAWTGGLELAASEQTPTPGDVRVLDASGEGGPAHLTSGSQTADVPAELRAALELRAASGPGGSRTADAPGERRTAPAAGGPRQSDAPAELRAAAAPKPAVEFPPVPSILASATPEPVIDDALLFSLFGGDDEPAPPPPAPSEPQTVQPPRTGPGVPVAAAAAVPTHQPGPFLPMAIRPAGAPGKPRLMQSFQAVAMVSASPQIPVWNMLPLRPMMSLGRPPGPGVGLVDRARPEAGAVSERKPGAVGDAELLEDLSVPTFGSVTKSRPGLSRWFKLSILAGVLGLAGGTSWLLYEIRTGEAGAEMAASGWERNLPSSPAGARQHMTTEFAACRN